MAERYANPCRMSATWEPDRVLVRLEGEIDLSGAQYLADYLDLILEQGTRRLVLDVEHLEFIDSSAMAVIVGAARRCVADGGSLALQSASPLVDVLLGILPCGSLVALPGSGPPAG